MVHFDDTTSVSEDDDAWRTCHGAFTYRDHVDLRSHRFAVAVSKDGSEPLRLNNPLPANFTANRAFWLQRLDHEVRETLRDRVRKGVAREVKAKADGAQTPTLAQQALDGEHIQVLQVLFRLRVSREIDAAMNRPEPDALDATIDSLIRSILEIELPAARNPKLGKLAYKLACSPLQYSLSQLELLRESSTDPEERACFWNRDVVLRYDETRRQPVTWCDGRSIPFAFEYCSGNHLIQTRLSFQNYRASFSSCQDPAEKTHQDPGQKTHAIAFLGKSGTGKTETAIDFFHDLGYLPHVQNVGGISQSRHETRSESEENFVKECKRLVEACAETNAVFLIDEFVRLPLRVQSQLFEMAERATTPFPMVITFNPYDDANNDGRQFNCVTDGRFPRIHRGEDMKLWFSTEEPQVNYHSFLMTPPITFPLRPEMTEFIGLFAFHCQLASYKKIAQWWFAFLVAANKAHEELKEGKSLLIGIHYLKSVMDLTHGRLADLSLSRKANGIPDNITEQDERDAFFMSLGIVSLSSEMDNNHFFISNEQATSNFLERETDLCRALQPFKGGDRDDDAKQCKESKSSARDAIVSTLSQQELHLTSWRESSTTKVNPFTFHAADIILLLSSEYPHIVLSTDGSENSQALMERLCTRIKAGQTNKFDWTSQIKVSTSIIIAHCASEASDLCGDSVG